MRRFLNSFDAVKIENAYNSVSQDVSTRMANLKITIWQIRGLMQGQEKLYIQTASSSWFWVQPGDCFYNRLS